MEFYHAYWLWKHNYINKPSEYFNMELIDQDILKVFIEKREEDNQEQFKNAAKMVKDCKDPYSLIGQLLFNMLYVQLS